MATTPQQQAINFIELCKGNPPTTIFRALNVLNSEVRKIVLAKYKTDDAKKAAVLISKD